MGCMETFQAQENWGTRSDKDLVVTGASQLC